MEEGNSVEKTRKEDTGGSIGAAFWERDMSSRISDTISVESSSTHVHWPSCVQPEDERPVHDAESAAKHG